MSGDELDLEIRQVMRDLSDRRKRCSHTKPGSKSEKTHRGVIVELEKRLLDLEGLAP